MYNELATVNKDSAMFKQAMEWKDILKEDIQEFGEIYKGSEEELAVLYKSIWTSRVLTKISSHSPWCMCSSLRNPGYGTSFSKPAPSYNAFCQKNSFVKESKQKMNAREKMIQQEAKDPEMTWKGLGAWGRKGWTTRNQLFKAGKRMGNRKWTMFWFRWNQSTTNIPQQEKKELPKKKRNNLIHFL